MIVDILILEVLLPDSDSICLDGHRKVQKNCYLQLPDISVKLCYVLFYLSELGKLKLIEAQPFMIREGRSLTYKSRL